MTLGEWLKREGRTQAWVAGRLGVSRSLVNDWIKGRRIPKRNHVEMLTVLSTGAVRPSDWLDPGAIE